MVNSRLRKTVRDRFQIQDILLEASGYRNWVKFWPDGLPGPYALLTCSVLYIPTIGDKIVETLYSNRITSENKRIHTPPLPPP